MRLVNLIYWLEAFLAPVLLLGIIGFAINKKDILLILLVIGGVAGIIFAEYIRRRYGLSTFFGRICGPNDMDKKLSENKTLEEEGTKS